MNTVYNIDDIVWHEGAQYQVIKVVAESFVEVCTIQSLDGKTLTVEYDVDMRIS